MRHSLKLCAAALLMIILTGCATFHADKGGATETRTLTATHVDNAGVYVETSNGSINIAADDSVDDVQITARVTAAAATEEEAAERLAATKIIVERDSRNVLTIHPQWPDDRRWSSDGASFDIRLPNANGITLETSNGAVTVVSLSGPLSIDTSNGKIEVRDYTGDADLETSNGGVAVYNHNGRLHADTSNGGIKVVNHRGGLNVDTSNGGIDVALADDQIGPIKLDTSNGSIKVSVGPKFGGTVVLDTSNGGITINDPGGAINTRVIKDSEGRIVLKNAGGESIVDTSNAHITFEIRAEDRMSSASEQ